MVVLIVLYVCTTLKLTKRLEKKLGGNYTRMLRAILNKSWRQHPSKQQLYGHLPPITKTIKFRRTSHAWHCWRSTDELIIDVLQWTPSHGRSKAGRPARTYIEQFYLDKGCSLKNCLSPCTLKSLYRIDTVQLRMICTSFNGYHYTTTVCCWGRTNIISLYNELSSLVLYILNTRF